MRYDENKLKPQKVNRYYNYLFLMLNITCSMFEYPAISENGIELQTLLKYAMEQGCSGVVFDNDEQQFKCGKLTWSTVRNDNGIADKCILHGVNWAKEYDTEKVAYYRNYYTQTPEMQMMWFAEQLAETDNSQRTLLRHSKCTPIPVASNKTERIEYENAMKRSIAGEDVTVLVRPKSNQLLNDGRTLEDDRIIHLTDPNDIEKMHFLSEYHAFIKSRFGALYGMCFRNSAKSAQETVDEVHGMDNFSLIIPHMKLDELKLFADKCKSLWGWSGSETVDFSELWKRENISAYNETVLKDGETQAEVEQESEGETNDNENQ